MARILNISDKRLFPVRTGDQKTNFELLKFLASKGHKITIVNLCSDRGPNVYNGEKVHWIHSSYNLRTPLYKYPFRILLAVLRFLYLKIFKVTVRQPFVMTKSELRKVEDIINEEKIDTLIMQRAHIGRYMKMIKGANDIFKVLQAHDLQYMRDYRFQKFRGKDISRNIEKHVKCEVEILNMFDKVIDLASYEVDDLINRDTNPARLYSKGTPVPYVDYSSFNRNAVYDLLFVGGDLYQNRVSLNWFIQNIWNKINSNGYTFAIAGGICNWTELKRNEENIVLVGEFEDAHEIYIDSKIVIVPLRIGSGVKVKVVEALMNSKVVITNNVGVEGISIEDKKEYIHCEEPEEWIDVIENLITDNDELERIGHNAWLWASKNATIETVYGEFEEMIRSHASA